MIFIGNTIELNLQTRENDETSFTTVSSVEIQRKEFDAEQFNGIGYTREATSESYGEPQTHGIGFNGQGTSLQVSSNALKQPLYNFNFALILDDFRLKEFYELYLLSYALRSAGSITRFRMTDRRLYLSEPDSTIVRSGAVIDDDTNIQYKLKEVVYFLVLDTFEWSFKIGNLYQVFTTGREIEVESDSNQGSACFQSLEEIVALGSEVIGPGTGFGFEITEIPLPSEFLSGTVINYGTGFNLNNSFYFGHFEKNSEHMFCQWDPNSPATQGEVFVNITSELSNDYKLDGFINTRVLDDKILFLDRDDDSTTHYLRSFVPNPPETTAGLLSTREGNEYPLVFTMPSTNVNEFSFFIESEQADGDVILTPRETRFINTVTPVNQDFSVHWLVGTNFNGSAIPYRPTLGYWAAKEFGRRAFTEGNSPVQIGTALKPIPTLPNTPDEVSIKLTNENTNRVGVFWYGDQINLNTNSIIEVLFEIRQFNGTGGEGMAIVFHDDSRGVGSIGFDGGRLAYSGTIPGGGIDGNVAIAPSVAIEFDPFGNGGALNEPTGGSSADSYVRVTFNGDKFNKFYESVYPKGFDSPSGRAIRVYWNGPANELEVNITDLSDITTISYTIPGINLATRIGTGKCYVGITAASGAATNKHLIDRFQIGHNSRWRIDNTAGFRSELYDVNRVSGKVKNHDRVFGFTSTDLFLSRTVTIKANKEGSNIYYHICYDPLDSNNVKVYKTNGSSVFQTNRLLINEVTDGSIPEVEFGIDSPLDINKFYLTQGYKAGNVYTTTDFITYTNIGSWDQFSPTRENEGQIYKFRGTYLVRSPSRYVIDCFNDTFEDIFDLLDPAEQLTPEADSLFGAGRKITSCYSTHRFDTRYTDVSEEQIVICSTDTGDTNLACYSLKVVAVPDNSTSLLQEDNQFILQEDGTSEILLEDSL